MLAFLADGDDASIRALVEDPRVDPWVRGSGVVALEEMVHAGRLSREAAVAYFGELLRDRLEREYSNVWDSVVSCALDLHATELAAEIRRAFEEGLVDPFCVSPKEVEEELAEARELVLARSRRRSRGPIEDTVAEMSWWAGFRAGEARDSTPPAEQTLRERRKVGRNEPCPCGSGKKYKKCCLRSGQNRSDLGAPG